MTSETTKGPASPQQEQLKKSVEPVQLVEATELSVESTKESELINDSAANDTAIEPKPHTGMTLEDASNLISEGSQAMALNLFDDAAERFSLAVEIQVEHLGQYAPATAPSFYLYGKALLATAIQKNSVLGEKADLPAKNELKEDIKFDPIEEFEELSSEDEGEALGELDAPVDDFELAWENLDVARIILEQSNDDESKKQLADVHLALGDVSLESENFDQAVKDYEIALNIKLGLCGDRELAEAYFKLGLALEYSEQFEEAIKQVELAMNSLRQRVAVLEKIMVPGKGKGKEVETLDTKEIVELNGFLAEMENKILDIKSVIEKECEGEQIALCEPAKKVNVINNIGNLVKKKRAVVEVEGGAEQGKTKVSKIEDAIVQNEVVVEKGEVTKIEGVESEKKQYL